MVKVVLRTVSASLWKLSAPIWPVSRLLQGRWRFVWIEKDKDQKHIGYIRPDKTLKEFKKFIRQQGFKRHFMAYKDIDELWSLRKIHNRIFQYHLRVYKDFRLTGHYEIAPEAHPLKHLREIGLETRKVDFLNMLGDWVTFQKEPANTPTHRK